MTGLHDIHNLDYTVLLCARMAETKAFYRDVLGFPIEDDRENWVSFRVGASLLTLRPSPEPSKVQLAFRVPPAAIDACHGELVAKGVTITRGPLELPDWRHRAMFFPDPEGNIIEIYAEI